MIQLCRAEDGHLSQVNASLHDIERTGHLERWLHQEGGFDEDSVLAYLPDGTRLTTETVRTLAGSQDQTIFVFNKRFVQEDPEEVIRDLRAEMVLQPPVEENVAAAPPYRFSQLGAAYAKAATAHFDRITQLAVSTHYQKEALRIASANLDLNVLAVVDAFEALAVNAKRDLEKQSSLLEGLDTDLELIGRVRVHKEFVSQTVRRAVEAGDKSRTLGDYVSTTKMRQVAEGCAQTHRELRSRFFDIEGAVTVLTEGADAIRDSITSTKLLDDSDASLRRAQESLNTINDLATSAEPDSGHPPESALQELKQRDLALRNEVQISTEIKNEVTRLSIMTLRRISILNNDMLHIPPSLKVLQESFRSKTSFAHIQRLHNMLYAYGATVIEIVRRKEFARFFYQRAQNILEVMAKFSVNERKRRQVYRSEVHGQLPFDIKGLLEDSVPSIDFSPSGGNDVVYSLEREDVEGLFRLLDDLEEFARTIDPSTLTAVKQCRSALQKLVDKMDGLEIGFDRIAERSLLSASRISHSRRRSIEADEQVCNELVEQLRIVQDERTALQTSLRDVIAQKNSERERADQLGEELRQLRSNTEQGERARHHLARQHEELLEEHRHKEEELSKALVDVRKQAREADVIRQELTQVRAEFEEVRALEARNSTELSHLMRDHAEHIRLLEEARARGDGLEEQIRTVGLEGEKVRQALVEADLEKERLLKAQASEHDRIMRDHIAEADGDRAVLERQFFQLKADKEKAEQGLKEARAELEVATTDAVGLREELQRIEREVREAKQVERRLRDDLTAGRSSESEVEHRLEGSERLVAQLVDVALAFRTSHLKALNAAQSMSSHPTKQSGSIMDSTFSSGTFRFSSIIGQPDDPPPIDPSDPAAALEALRAFDHDSFMENITKTGSTIRKWQKQCKEYRERSKGKISFRNFTKGDLALFLPTRNSVSKPWAAFNVSFPHYFLQATGHLAEQLKTREWIVARITSITERIVNQNDPTSNPYGLGDGVKYYMLEVEDWTQQSQPTKRKGSRKVADENVNGKSESQMPSPLAATTVLPPPEAEVEETFRVTQPPNSRLFPARLRSDSSPSTRPSSLSRLLAQAAPENTTDGPAFNEGPTEAHSPPPQPPVSPPTPRSPGSLPKQSSSLTSPVRPASRASRLSHASRLSIAGGGRMPMGMANASTGVSSGSIKAAATTAISDQPFMSSPTSGDSASGSGGQATPSPGDSISEGMGNIPRNLARRRTMSYNLQTRSSPLVPSESSTSTTTVVPSSPSKPSVSASSALANLASSWGVSFGRRRKQLVAHLAEGSVTSNGHSDTATEDTLERE